MAKTLKSRIRAARRAVSRGFYFYYSRVSVLVTWLVALYFTILMFHDYERDTTIISNGAFAIVASLAALSFSCSRAIDDKEYEVRDRFSFAGERCLHSAVMLMLASVLKYGLLYAKSPAWISDHPPITFSLNILLGGMASVLFLWAMNSAHTGVRVINELLHRRFARQPDWDALV